MAMRPRGGGGGGGNRPRSAGVRPVYEDFKPISEWQENDVSHTLTIYLPGFMKEQIKVSTEGKNIVRVRGERLVAGNKWSRFLEDFQVPENCEMNSVRAKNQGGNLVITVPKKNVDKDIIAPQKPQEALSPKTTGIDSIPQKGQDKVLPKVILPGGTSQPTDENSIALQKLIDDLINTKSVTPPRKAEIIVPQTETTVDIGRKNLEKSEELSEVETGKKMKIDIDGAAHTELNEERQLLVNMGVAVLVLMALSAYVTYNKMSMPPSPMPYPISNRGLLCIAQEPIILITNLTG